jgi:hypothetical protein
MRRAEWEHDEAFVAIARVAWPDDIAAATRQAHGRAVARSRLKLRHEGYRSADHVEARIVQMQTEVSAMAKRVSEMRKVSP